MRHSKYDHFPRGCVWDEISWVKDYVDSHIFGGMSQATAELQPLPKIQRFKFGKMVFYYQQAVKPFTFLCEVQVNILCCGLDSNHILVQFNTRPSKKEDYRSPYFPIEIPFGSSKNWGSSNSFGSWKSRVSIEMTFRSKMLGVIKIFLTIEDLGIPLDPQFPPDPQDPSGPTGPPDYP